MRQQCCQILVSTFHQPDEILGWYCGSTWEHHGPCSSFEKVGTEEEKTFRFCFLWPIFKGSKLSWWWWSWPGRWGLCSTACWPPSPPQTFSSVLPTLPSLRLLLEGLHHPQLQLLLPGEAAWIRHNHHDYDHDGDYQDINCDYHEDDYDYQARPGGSIVPRSCGGNQPYFSLTQVFLSLLSMLSLSSSAK